MATLTIRGIPDDDKEALRVRAARHGRSMEAELRAIIHEVAREGRDEDEMGLGSEIRQLFSDIGGVDLPEHPPVTPREPPRFD